MKRSRWILATVGLVLSAAAVFVLLKQVSARDLWLNLRRADPGPRACWRENLNSLALEDRFLLILNSNPIPLVGAYYEHRSVAYDKSVPAGSHL